MYAMNGKKTTSSSTKSIVPRAIALSLHPLLGYQLLSEPAIPYKYHGAAVTQKFGNLYSHTGAFLTQFVPTMKLPARFLGRYGLPVPAEVESALWKNQKKVG
jgi:hypothetical protein